MPVLKQSSLALGRLEGSSPSEHRYYVLVMFDISDPKKARAITKVLRTYAMRIQFSVYEAWLRRAQIAAMTDGLRRIMQSERFYNPTDRVRVYRVGGSSEVTALGEHLEEKHVTDIII